jgi:hypothetical protein
MYWLSQVSCALQMTAAFRGCLDRLLILHIMRNLTRLSFSVDIRPAAAHKAAIKVSIWIAWAL